MTYYTKLIYQLKRKLSTFSNNINNNLSKPKSKFIFQMLYGLLENQSVLLSEIAALTNKHEMPVSVFSHIYSSREKGFKSQNIETLKGLDFAKKHFGNKGSYALDRWYDNNLYFKYFTKKMRNETSLLELKRIEMLFIRVIK